MVGSKHGLGWVQVQARDQVVVQVCPGLYQVRVQGKVVVEVHPLAVELSPLGCVEVQYSVEVLKGLQSVH